MDDQPLTVVRLLEKLIHHPNDDAVVRVVTDSPGGPLQPREAIGVEMTVAEFIIKVKG